MNTSVPAKRWGVVIPVAAVMYVLAYVDRINVGMTLYPSDRVVKAGGTIVVVTPCDEGVAVTHAGILALTRCSAGALRTKVAAHELHDEVAAALAIAWAQVKERENVFLVSRGIDAESARRLGFTRFDDVQAAFDAALSRHGREARVAVLTHAPDMLPLIK